MGQFRFAGLTTKIHAVADAKGLPIRLALGAGQNHGRVVARDLLTELRHDRAFVKRTATRLSLRAYGSTS